MKPRDSFKPNWDFYSIALMGLFVFYQVMQWPLLPKFVDIYYHLGVVKGFADAGGWVARDTWEFAPGGQPHLYPPLLHLLLLVPYKLGLDVISLARLVDVVSYPALLVSFWFFVRSREGSRAAFWILLLFSSVYSSYLSAVTLPAFNLAMIGALWSLYFLAAGRAWAAGLLGAAVAYSHTMGAGMLAGMLAVAAGFEPTLRKNALRAFGLAAVLAAPMLAWQASQAGAFELIGVGENKLIEFDPLLYGLAIYRASRSLKNKKFDVWPLAILFAMLPAVPFRQARVIGGYGVMAAAWLAGLETLRLLDALGAKRGRRTAVEAGVLTALFFSFLAPTCLWNRLDGRFRIAPMDRTLIRYVVPDERREFRAKGFSIYFEKEYAQILDVLKARTAPGDIFWTDFPHAGGILSMLSGRPMSTSMLGEVGSWQDRPARLDHAKLLVWFKTADGSAAPEIGGLMASMGLKPVAETDIAFILENPSGGSKAIPPKAVLPLGLLWGLLALWGAAFCVSLRR